MARGLDVVGGARRRRSASPGRSLVAERVRARGLDVAVGHVTTLAALPGRAGEGAGLARADGPRARG